MSNFLNILTPWLLTSGIKILGIIIVSYLICKIGKALLKKLITRLVAKTYRIKDRAALEKRGKTLVNVFSWFLNLVIWVVALIMIISEFGINVGPLLAGVGIAGLALGFGAQHLVRDFLAGLFIILEDQYRVGDVICIDGTCGGVEGITLRKTVLRDLDGVQHHIPNGEIRKASNLSKGFSRVNLNIGVAYKEDLDKVIEVINRVGREMAEDPKWKEVLVEEPITKSQAPQVLGVDDFADSAIIIKVVGSTKPLQQWNVARELRKRIKIAFDKEGIEIPFPQMSIWPRGPWEKGK